MKKTTTTSKTHFTLDFFNKTISGTKASFNKANKGFGAEYEELTAKMTAHPDFTLVIKEPKTKITRAKRDYAGMDFKFMEDYIATLDNAESTLDTYKAVKAEAENCKISVYPFTKKWFIKEFGTEEEGFDMKSAKERITNFRMAKAEENAKTLIEKKNNNQTENKPVLVPTLVEDQALAAD